MRWKIAMNRSEKTKSKREYRLVYISSGLVLVCTVGTPAPCVAHPSQVHDLFVKN